VVDRVFDAFEEAASNFLELDIPREIWRDCIRVAFLNVRICEMLLICFEAMVKGKGLRKKTLAFRI
jgi:hypothetical protein